MGLLDIFGGNSNQSVDACVALGEDALERGRGAEAENRFRQALHQEPAHRRAGRGLMKSWLLQAKSDQVIEFYETLSVQEKIETEDYLFFALAMEVGSLKVDRYARWLRIPKSGAQWLNEVRELAKKDSKCGVFSVHWAEAGLQAFQMEEVDEALKQLRDAEPSLPSERVAYLHAKRDATYLKESPEISRLLIECSRIEDPVERVRRLGPVATQVMEVAPLQHDTGLAFHHMGKSKVAIRYLNRAVGLNPFWVNAWTNLGLASLRANRYVRARDSFARVLQLKPSDWVDRQYLKLEELLLERPEYPFLEDGKDRLEVGDYFGAAAAFRTAISYAPDYYEAKYLLGHALFHLDDYENALPYLRMSYLEDESLEGAEKLERKRFLELCAHARALELIQDYEDFEFAFDLLEELLQSKEIFLLLLDDFQLFKALEKGSLSMAAYTPYCQAYGFYEHTIEQRLALLEQAVAEEPNFVSARIARAVWFSENGDGESAHQELMYVYKQDQENAAVLFHLGGLAFLGQDIENAVNYWSSCGNMTQSPWAKVAQRNIESLSSQGPSLITIALLPLYYRVIDFSPGTGVHPIQVPPAMDTVPGPTLQQQETSSQDDQALFEISESSAQAPQVPLEKMRRLAQNSVPRLSNISSDTEATAERPSYSDLRVVREENAAQDGAREENEEAFVEEFFKTAPSENVPVQAEDGLPADGSVLSALGIVAEEEEQQKEESLKIERKKRQRTSSSESLSDVLSGFETDKRFFDSSDDLLSFLDEAIEDLDEKKEGNS